MDNEENGPERRVRCLSGLEYVFFLIVSFFFYLLFYYEDEVSPLPPSVYPHNYNNTLNDPQVAKRAGATV